MFSCIIQTDFYTAIKGIIAVTENDMINYIISVSGLIISTLGIIQVLQSYYFEKPVRRYFLWIFSILIAYAASNLLSWATYGIPSPGGILASKTALFLESVLSCALILC